MTSDADREAFRRVYPFSPAMIETLVAVSSYLQRERTALRLLLQLLVDKRDELTVGDLVPLGDLYDVIRGGEEPFSDELKRHFIRAKDLYRTKLRPMLLDEHGLKPEEAKNLPPGAPVPDRRPADQDAPAGGAGPGSCTTKGVDGPSARGPQPRHHPDAGAGSREGGRADPAEELEPGGAGAEAGGRPAGPGSLAPAHGHRHRRHPGSGGPCGQRWCQARQGPGADLRSLEIDDDNGLFAATRTWVWRGSRRKADVRFGNVRDHADIPSSEFRSQEDRPRVVIDFPFDEADHGPADDLARMQELQEELDPTPTVAWLPLFLTQKSLENLGRLVVLDHILAGDRLDGFTTHLSPEKRLQAGHLLKNMADSLRTQLHDVLRQAYGIDTPDQQWVRTDLPLHDQFPCLDPTMDVRPPTTANLERRLRPDSGPGDGSRVPRPPQVRGRGEARRSTGRVEAR